MDYDISRWLKDDLGLIHMSEADLNNLMFHPRYGTLCRRFVRFLAESTFCNKKYPNVYAKEQHLESIKELKKKNDDLGEAIKLLENYVKDSENEERELGFLQLKLDHLRNIEDLQRTSTEALEEIANRPNLGIEQITRNIEELEYLSNTDLATIYSKTEFNKYDSIITNRQMTILDEELNDLMGKIDVLHRAITKMLLTLTEKIDNIDGNLQPRKTNIQNLIALKAPESEEIILNMDPDEMELKDINVDLSEKVCDLDQQVTEMSNQYKTRKIGIIKAYKEQLKKSLYILTDLEEIENIIQDYKDSCR